MREKLKQLKENINAANNQPVYAVGAKMAYAEKAVNNSYELVSMLVDRVEALENAKN